MHIYIYIERERFIYIYIYMYIERERDSQLQGRRSHGMGGPPAISFVPASPRQTKTHVFIYV